MNVLSMIYPYVSFQGDGAMRGLKFSLAIGLIYRRRDGTATAKRRLLSWVKS